MAVMTATPGRTATEVAPRGICRRTGYYFKVTPRPVGRHFWVGAFADHNSANEARRKDYPWPRYETDEPWYFTDGCGVS